MLVAWIKECECKAEDTLTGGEGKPVEVVSLDHYRECPNPPYPRILLEALYADTQGKRYGRSEWVPSVSQLTRCPVEVALEVNFDWVTKPMERRFMLRGTFAHEGILERNTDSENWLIEKEMEYEFGDYTLHGTLDAYHYPSKAIFDLKTQREYALEKKSKQTDQEMINDPQLGQFTRDNMNQISFYRALARETLDLEINYTELQYFDGGLRFRCLEVPDVPQEKILPIIQKKTEDLVTAVENINIETAEFVPKHKTVNQFPLNKSPIKHLYLQYLKEHDARVVSETNE